jgi:hypothetical protein
MDNWFFALLIVLVFAGMFSIIYFPYLTHKKRVDEIIKNIKSTKRTMYF